MKSSFFKKISRSHTLPKELPGVAEIDEFIINLMQFLFPELNNIRLQSELEINTGYNLMKLQFQQLLLKTKACHAEGIHSVCEAFFNDLEHVYDRCLEDAEAILSGDPAAHDRKEIIRCYPGFYAIAVYRVAHAMLGLGIPYLPRILTEHAHGRTGIDIHPGAEIGHSFCIDHGTGVVIGETTIIGDQVKLYQGVTLGALSVSKGMAKTKRHPTIGNNVVIYAGATILGGETIVGDNCIIGGNVWLTHSLKSNSKIFYDSDDAHTLKEI